MPIWFDFLATLDHRYKRWMQAVTLKGFDARNLYLKAETPFHILWFKEHVQPHFIHFLKRVKRRSLQVHLELPHGEKKSLSLDQQMEKDSLPQPLFSFANFYLSKHQKLLQFAIQSQPSLLFLYGDSGVGKSHLLNSFAGELALEKKRVLAVDTRRFVWHFTTAIRTKQMATFRAFYRNSEALCLDNIEQLEEKKATQEEFFHLFNALEVTNRPMVFTSKHPPNQLSLPARLVSRFSKSLVIPLKPTPHVEIPALLQIKAHALGLKIEPELLSSFEQLDARNAVTAFDTFLIRTHGEKEPWKSDQVEKFIADFREQKGQSTKKILSAITQVYQICPSDLFSKSKKFAKQRTTAMYFCRKKLKLSFTAIGKIFQKDHSTVISALKKFDPQSSECQKVEAILQS